MRLYDGPETDAESHKAQIDPLIRAWVEAYIEKGGRSENSDVVLRIWRAIPLIEQRALTSRPDLVFGLAVIEAKYSALMFLRSTIAWPNYVREAHPQPPQYFIKKMADYLQQNFQPSFWSSCCAFGRTILRRPQPRNYIPLCSRQQYVRLLEKLWVAWHS